MTQALESGDFEEAVRLNVDVEGFEGPLDLLLELARTQKVDLTRISILALAEQYLSYIEEMRRRRIEIAADYLVMAAWLAYLKSKLLLPAAEEDPADQSGAELAAALAFRLRRLEAMREAATRLVNRNRLGRDFFPRGMPEAVIVETTSRYSASLYDLLTAYAARRQKSAVRHVTIAHREVFSLSEARELLVRLVGTAAQWTPLDIFLKEYLPAGRPHSSILASSFAAMLELVREGRLAMRQGGAYQPLYLRAASPQMDRIEQAGDRNG